MRSIIWFTDKQQELDIPSLRVDEGPEPPKGAQRKERPRGTHSTMSQISGVNRKPLCHTNSFTGERLPTHGVETPYEDELGKAFLRSHNPVNICGILHLKKQQTGRSTIELSALLKTARYRHKLEVIVFFLFSRRKIIQNARPSYVDLTGRRDVSRYK